MTCFDTTILIWGIQGAAGSEQRGMVARTRRFLEHLQQTGESVIVPAPVLAEYLTGFEPAKQRRQRKILETKFRIPAFDIDAAAIAAELGYDVKFLKQVRAEHNVQRQALKFDVQIIAIAILNGANRIVTNDRGAFQKLAANRIKIVEVPDVPRQQRMAFD